MQSNIGRIFAATVLVVGAGACADMAPSSPSYKPGELGNGGFQFTCDDSVACNKFNAAQEFPNTVAQGASFTVRYVPRDATQTKPGSNAGITTSPVGTTFLSTGPDGLVGVRAGVGTITARNAQGSLVEFTAIKIERPDAIVVYDGEYTGTTTPVTIDKVTLKVNEVKTLRALARRTGHDLAGLLTYEWSTDTSSVVKVDTVTNGKVTLVGKSAGSAKIIVKGGSFEQDVPVEVSQ
jgi:hypothetical protein